MLTKYADEGFIKSNLKDFDFFHAPSDRAYWDGLKEYVKDYIRVSLEKFETYTFEPLTLSSYREFHTLNDRVRFEAKYFSRRHALIAYTLAEVTENEGKYTEKIADLVWMMLEESSWVIPAHVHLWGRSEESLPDCEHPIIDLFAAETAASLAFTYFVMKDKFDAFLNSTKLSERIEIEVKKRVIDRFLDTHHWWTGFRGERAGNNWNPWCTSNILIALSVFEKDPETKAAVICRALKSLSLYFNEYPKDGACDEGPDYWYHSGGTAIMCLYLMKGMTGGAINEMQNPQVQNLAEYIPNVQITDEFATNFADCAGKVPVRCGALYKFGEMTENKTLQNFAKFFCLRDGRVPVNYTRPEITPILFMAELLSKAPFEEEDFNFTAEHYFESTNVLTARFGKTLDKGIFFAAKGGNNNECHNHNDVGNFIVFKDGTPFIVDSGPMVYSALTFKEETRYTIWTNKSEYHNTPTIGGKNQPVGKEYAATDVSFESSENEFSLSMDLKEAYENKDTIKFFKRTFVGDRTNDSITVTENYELVDDAPITLNFMTTVPFEFKGDCAVLTAENGVSVTLSMNFSEFNIETETISHPEDGHIMNSWGGTLYRTRFTLKKPEKAGTIAYTIQ